jgi:hypothetical protein
VALVIDDDDKERRRREFGVEGDQIYTSAVPSN